MELSRVIVAGGISSSAIPLCLKSDAIWGASGPHRVRFAPWWGAPLGYFSLAGKVTKSAFKKTSVFLKIFPHYFFSFALALWLVWPKLRSLPCMRRSGCFSMSPRRVKRWCRDSLGALVGLAVDLLLVAPFHYAIDGFPYTVWDGLRSAPFHSAKEKCFVYGSNSTAPSIA